MSATEVLNWLRDREERVVAESRTFLDEHMPGLIAFAQKAESSPIVAALEGVLLPPEVEQEIANIIRVLAPHFPPPPAPAPAAEAEAGAEQVAQ